MMIGVNEGKRDGVVSNIEGWNLRLKQSTPVHYNTSIISSGKVLDTPHPHTLSNKQHMYIYIY